MSCFENNTDYIGVYTNICIQVDTDTIEACQIVCQKDPSCNFFVWTRNTYKDSKNKCCLKDQVRNNQNSNI